MHKNIKEHSIAMMWIRFVHQEQILFKLLYLFKDKKHSAFNSLA